MKKLGLEIAEKILFSDSLCVLHWLKTKKPLSLLIENRAKEIFNKKDTTFRYNESTQNPADVVSQRLVNQIFGGMVIPGLRMRIPFGYCGICLIIHLIF